jgi:hypothetical protein
MRVSTTRPASTRLPFTIPTAAAPTAMVDGSSRKGRMARLSASGSRMVSASSAITPRIEAALMPAFDASAFAPAVLLVDHDQVGLVERSIHPADGGRRDVLGRTRAVPGTGRKVFCKRAHGFPLRETRR